MTLEIWLAFVALTFTFLLTPGTSHLLMISNSLAYGGRRAMATAGGDLSANVLQMLAAGFGMAALLQRAPQVFTIIKWVGVVYLFYLGIKRLFSAVKSEPAPAVTARNLYKQGFVNSGSNPRAIVFFAALFPQFISPDAALIPQLAVLMATYLAFDAAFLIFYGFSADTVKRLLRGNGEKTLNMISGISVIFAAVLLAFISL